MTRLVNYQHLYLRRAERVAFLLAGLPFLRFVGLTGSVAHHTATKTSDIDLFIVAAPGRIFTTRFLATFLIQCLGLRRHGTKVAGRMCLNRWQTTDHLEITPHTSYHAHDLSQLLPLVDLDHVYRRYQEANHWMTHDFGQVIDAPQRRVSRSLFLSRWTRQFFERLLVGQFGTWLEGMLKAYQLRFMARNPETHDLRAYIVVTDQALLFHPIRRDE